MIPTQDARTSAPPWPASGTVRPPAPGAAGLVLAPDASPACSSEQTCTRCQRSGAIKLTVNVGERKWLYCAICIDRGNKTTRLADSGRASLATIASVGLYGTVLAALAGGTGKLGWLADALPHPSPNGFSLLCLLVLVAGCFWRLNRDNEKWPAGAEPLADVEWPDLHPDDAAPTLLPTEPKRVRS